MSLVVNLYELEGGAIPKTQAEELAKAGKEIIILLEPAKADLIESISVNIEGWLSEEKYLSLDCRRIVDNEQWKVPTLTTDFLPKLLLFSTKNTGYEESVSILKELRADSFYSWPALQLSYRGAYHLIMNHSTHYHCAAVSVTDFCNLHCKMCAFHSNDPDYEFSHSRRKDRKPQELSKENYLKFLDEIYPNVSLLFLGSGELFVSKNWSWFLERAYEKGFRSRICTNGMLVDEKVSKKLLDLDIQEMIFSVDGHRKEMVENIRHGCNFDTVSENIRNFIRLRDEKKSTTFVNIHCCLNKDTIQEKYDIARYWKYFGVDNLIFCVERKDWFRNADVRFIKGLGHDFHEMPCWNPLDTIGVTTEGNIIPCFIHMQSEWADRPMDWLMNIAHNPLEKIITDYRKMRLDKRSPYFIHSCARCTEKQQTYLFDGMTTSTEAYRFTGKVSPKEAAFTTSEMPKAEKRFSFKKIIKKLLGS